MSSGEYIGPNTSNLIQDNWDRKKTPEEAIAIAWQWFEWDRTSKFHYTQEMEEMYLLYKGDHWDLHGTNGKPLRNDKQKAAHPNVVENVTFALVEGLVSEFSQEVEVSDFPVEEEDKDAADVMTDLKRFLYYKNRIINEREKFLRNFFLYGTAIWHTYWDPNWIGGKGPNKWVGDIRWKSLHPNFFYPDGRCRESIEDGTRAHKAFYVTLESLRDMFPDTGEYVQSDVIGADMLIGMNRVDMPFEATQDQALLVETWYKGKPLVLDEGEEDQGNGLHVIWWAGEGQRVYLKHANYVDWDPEEECKFPFIVKQCYPRENSIWGFGEAFMLKNPQIIKNKTSEMIIEGHMHHAMGQTLYQKGSLNKKQEQAVQDYGTMAGMWFDVDDINGIKREYGQGVPQSLIEESQRMEKMMETIIGRFDISQGKNPGSVTAFRALDLLAARAQVRLRSKEMSITSSYEEVGTYMNQLITRNYTEQRAYRILGPEDGDDGQPAKLKYGMFRADDFKKAYLFQTGQSIPLNQFQAMQPPPGQPPDPNNPYHQMQEGQDFEVYSPQFDVMSKVSTTLPSDRLFYMDMAKELFQAQLIDGETFWYVLKNAKFPPFEELMEKEVQKHQAQQQAAQQQAQMQAQLEAMKQKSKPAESIRYSDLPPEGKLQLAAQAGIQLSPQSVAMHEAQQMAANQPAQQAPDGQGSPQEQQQQAGPEDSMNKVEQLLQSRPDLVQKLARLPLKERQAMIQQLMQVVSGGQGQ